MERTCSKCGALTPPEARFCRHCGTPLRTVASYNTGENISPLAQTVPLSGEGLTTSNLGTTEDGGSAPDTKRVVRAEMEQLLRNSRFNAPPDGRKPDGDGTTTIINDYAAPPTGELVPVGNAPAVAAAAPAQSPPRAATTAQRPRRTLVLVTALLLLATLSGALLAYYFLRRRAPQNAANVASETNTNQVAEPTNSPVAATGTEETPTPDAAPSTETAHEETPQPSPKASASVDATREARARQERERETETETHAPAGAPPTASPAPPAPQATPTPTQTQTTVPAPARTNTDTPAAQATSDTFYFQAVNLVNGREPRTMPRAELLRALQLFQNVVNGPHAAEARRQAARLGRELDRLNKSQR